MTTYSWTTANATATKSGTGWSIDVTGCNLSIDLTDKDFIVLFDEIVQNNNDFTKTTSTSLTYNGSSIPSTDVEVRRFTSEDPYRLVSYRGQFSSDDWNRELERISRRAAELNLNGVGATGDLDVTIRNDAYAASWSADIVNGTSRKTLYDKFEAMEDAYQAGDSTLQSAINLKAPSASPTFTGIVTVPTPTAGDNTTKAASTAYVKGELTAYAPLNNPTFTGSPKSTTPSADDNSTNIATTAFVQTEINNNTSYQLPVGSIYLNAIDATNPSTLLGYGTWVAFGTGRVLVGFSAGESEFNAPEKQGGEKAHVLTQQELPAHVHGIPMDGGQFAGGGSPHASSHQASGTNTGKTTFSTGDNFGHNNLQPFITVYMWKRTA